ncbi:MAG: hypothetical protein AB7G17_11925 [Phycisphaerales bacterium]
MTRFANAARQPTLTIVCLGSIAAAGAALWTFLSPETIPLTTTGRLVALLGLFILPVATLALSELDRRHAPHALPDPESPSNTESDDIAVELPPPTYSFTHAQSRLAQSAAAPARTAQPR